MDNQYQDFDDDAESDTGDFNPTAEDSDNEEPRANDHLGNGETSKGVQRNRQDADERHGGAGLEVQEEVDEERDHSDGDAAGEDDEGPGEDLGGDDDEDEEDNEDVEDAVCSGLFRIQSRC